MFDSDDEPPTIYSSSPATHLEPEPKSNSLVWVIAGAVVALAVVAAVVGFFMRADSTEAVAEPIPVELNDLVPDLEEGEMSADAVPDTDAGTESVPPASEDLDCTAAEQESIDMASEQHTGGPSLVGIGEATVVVDNQANPSNNGWLLRCEGKGVFSGGPKKIVDFGYQNKSGETYVVMKPR